MKLVLRSDQLERLGPQVISSVAWTTKDDMRQFTNMDLLCHGFLPKPFQLRCGWISCWRPLEVPSRCLLKRLLPLLQAWTGSAVFSIGLKPPSMLDPAQNICSTQTGTVSVAARSAFFCSVLRSSERAHTSRQCQCPLCREIWHLPDQILEIIPSGESVDVCEEAGKQNRAENVFDVFLVL